MNGKFANLLLTLFLVGSIKGQTVTFSNVTESAGISHDRRIYGSSLVDWNNDGFLDIFIASTSGNDYLFTSNGDMTYTENFSSVGFSHEGNSAGALFADFDDDNDLDVFFGMRGSSNLFYENINNEFIEVRSALAESDSSKAAGMGVADFNGDGLLDLYQSNWDAQNVLYNNEGDWVFSDATENSTAMHTGVAMGMGFFDCDNDGDQDLYLTHDGYQGNRLYRNNSDGTFTDISAVTNTGIRVQGMGVTFGDFDNNGFIDIYTANMDSNRLLINNGDGTFTDVTASAGVGDTGMGWGVVSFDYDNDGWLDIYVNNETPFNQMPNVLYRNNGDDTFSNTAVEAGVASEGSGYGLATGDLNNDGWLDLFLANNSGSELFLNSGGNNNWVKFKLRGIRSNLNAIGTRVVVNTGELSMTREVRAGESYVSQNSFELHFGLEANTVIDSVIIYWHSGLVESYYDLTINSLHRLTEGGSVGVEEENEIISANEFKIISAYPNPFNPTITIDYRVPAPSKIVISVHDIRGRIVNTIYDGVVSAGRNIIMWNGKTADGNSAASGVYIVKILSDTKVSSKKILLLK